jgi:uncharacterized protein (TIGR02284 family)
MTETLDSLTELHTSLVDTRHGYEAALKDEPGSDMAPIFTRMAALHSEAADEVARILERMGAAADEEGSFMSTVHRTVIGARSMITGLNENILPSLISGEERNIGQYDAAIEASSMDSGVETTLRSLRERLERAIDDMRHVSSMA